MKILFADSLDDAAIERLRATGDECLLAPELTGETLPERIGDAEALVVRSTKVNAATIDAAKDLGLVVRAGAGINTIDFEHAAANGVFVCNVPGRNAIAVAELAFGLILAIDRHIAASTAELRAGTWNKNSYSDADGLYGATIGIVGVGGVGLALAERAAAFGMQVVAEHKPNRRPDVLRRMSEIGIETVPDRNTLLAESQVVSIHVPSDPSTVSMIDAEFLAAMRDRAILINTSRGDTMDAAALIEAMNERGIRCGLDVYPDEPSGGAGEFVSDLASHPNVVGTHHIGASTEQAQRAIAEGTVDVIESYRKGEIVHCVNLETAPERVCKLTVRHHDRVGVLASVLDVLREAEVNISTMHNQVFAGSTAAAANIYVSRQVSGELRATIESLEHVIGVSVTE